MFSVGVMPADTIGGMSPNVWWIAAGSTKTSTTSSRSDPSPGQILMVDMTKSNFSEFFIIRYFHLPLYQTKVRTHWQLNPAMVTRMLRGKTWTLTRTPTQSQSEQSQLVPSWYGCNNRRAMSPGLIISLTRRLAVSLLSILLLSNVEK